MAEKIKGIVLKSSDRKEKDLNVLLFSLEKGKIWVTLRGVKGQNAKMKLAQNQFCFGEFVMENGKNGQIVTGFECLESFHELSENIDHFFEASAVLEVVDKLKFSSETEIAQIFLLVLKTFKMICFGNLKNEYALDKFFISLFQTLGVPLYSDKCSCCGTKAIDRVFIDYAGGGLVCMACKGYGSEELPKNVVAALKILTITDFEKLGSVKFSANSELQLLKILVKNFETRFDQNLKLIGILT